MANPKGIDCSSTWFRCSFTPGHWHKFELCSLEVGRGLFSPLAVRACMNEGMVLKNFVGCDMSVIIEFPNGYQIGRVNCMVNQVTPTKDGVELLFTIKDGVPGYGDQ